MYKIQLNSYLSILIMLLGCAAIENPTGGPADIKGPQLLSIKPENNSNINLKQKIIYEFDELIDPSSIPAAININPDIRYKLKIKNQKITIYPDKEWPNNILLKISLSRKIRDYQKNIMSNSINTVFSTGALIPNGKINGQIINYDNKNIIEIGLFNWPVSDSSKYIEKIEINEQGLFNFYNLNYGNYTIVALEGSIWNIKTQIEKRNYAMLSTNYISVNSKTNNVSYKMLLSDPPIKQKITSIEMLSQYALNLIMTDNTKEYFALDSNYKPGDSIYINLIKTNKLEKYSIPEYSFILPKIIDTIGPSLVSSQFIDNNLILEFSEPIIIEKEALTSNIDSQNVIIDFILNNNNSVKIVDLKNNIENIIISGSLITDWEKNNFIDSLKVIKLNPYNISKKLTGGNIFGAVNYTGKKRVKVEAYNIDSKLYFYSDVIDNKFHFLNLPTGLYNIWAYEILNSINPNVYFSGLWSPYKRAAQFSFYPDTIDVRARWDIENININFN